METLKILKLLRETSSTNDKQKILKDNKDNKELEKILKYTYDGITYTYGIRSWNMKTYSAEPNANLTLEEVLESLSSRKVTGDKAGILANSYYKTLDEEHQKLFCQILDHDLKIGVGSKTLNKIWKNLIPKPYYCRCGIFSKSHSLGFPAIIQLKCDGTYREAYVHGETVTFKTRSGEDYENPVMSSIMKNLPDGYYLGEFTIGPADEPSANRAEGNGLINSKYPPYEDIHFTLWDYLTDEEYALKELTPYSERFCNLVENLKDNEDNRLTVVPSEFVNSNKEALQIVSEWMNKGLEGGVLKSVDMVFKNGTSNKQLKIKLQVDADLRCKELILGNEGTKYEDLIKVIYFESDDGKIKGQCSGMTDDMIHEVTKNPENYLGKIVTVQFNDLSLAQGSDTYALSHPRFVGFRDDKTESDTLERVMELRDMAKNL